MPLIGYARVSTGEQTLDSQLVELRKAGCELIHGEHTWAPTAPALPWRGSWPGSDPAHAGGGAP